jgi:hypothetical protein
MLDVIDVSTVSYLYAALPPRPSFLLLSVHR